MNNMLYRLYKFFEEIADKLNINDAIKLIDDFGLIILIITCIVSIIMLIYYAYKKQFKVNYIYAMLISLSIYGVTSLFTEILSRQFSIGRVFNDCLIIFIPLILIIIISLFMVFVDRSNKIEKVDYDEVKNNVLSTCDICGNQYKKKDMLKDQNICKICAKEKENS